MPVVIGEWYEYDKNFDKDVKQLISWSDEFSVSHKGIDNQHKELIAIIEELVSIIHLKNYNYINLVNIVNKLENYIKVHFEYEEKLMIKYSYPYVEIHTKEHNELRYKIRNTKVFEVESMDAFYTDTLIYLVDWLTNHIMHVDKQLGKFLSEAGER
ncbi:MAG: bacteriohemerythrin [Mobilitalea sp.]